MTKKKNQTNEKTRIKEKNEENIITIEKKCLLTLKRTISNGKQTKFKETQIISNWIYLSNLSR